MIQRTIDGVHQGNIRPQKIEAVKFAPNGFEDAQKEAARVIKWLRSRGYPVQWSELKTTATVTKDTGDTRATLELAFENQVQMNGLNIESGKWVVLFDEPQPTLYGPGLPTERRIIVIGDQYAKFHFEGLVDA